MNSPQLNEYVRQRLSTGESIDAIHEDLKRTGWDESAIQAALGTPAVPTAASGSITSAPSPKRWGLLVGVVIGVLAVVGGASATYLLYFKANPDKIVGEALSAMIDLNAVEYAASLKIEATSSATSSGAMTILPILGASDDSKKPMKLLLTLEGAYDRLDRAQTKSKMNVKIASTEVMNGSPIVGLSVLQLPEATYLSLTDAPSNMFIDLSPIVGTWIKIDPKSLVKQFASNTATPETTKKQVTAEQTEALKLAFAQTRPIRVTETLKAEEVDGVSSLHYRLAIEKDALKEFVIKTQEIMDGEASLAYEKFNDDYERFSKQLNITSLEMWIGKESGLPTRFSLQATAKESEDVPAEGTLAFDLKLKNFNQTPTIEAPKESKTFEEIFGELMGGAMESSSDNDTRSTATKRIDNIHQIQTALELGYSEANAYPIAAQPIIVGGKSASVLCLSNRKAAWVATSASCNGTVYLGNVPSEPSPASASYLYRSKDGMTYTLQFSLAEGAGQLTEGPQCASQDGIVSLTCDTNDWDGDGLSDADEARYSSDPKLGDTDNDGFTDGAEVAGGYNPNGAGKL
ncbi:MAG: thrombospondin type 3 repeat-containing protein [Patescibacteria group bacterium]|jgi:hypothetical protein